MKRTLPSLFALLLAFALLTASPTRATTSYIAAVGNPPVVTSLAWKAWYNRLLAFRLAEVSTPRTTTYYFAANGNDSTGNGSIATPYASLAKAQTLLAANVRLRFRRGDTFRAYPAAGVPALEIASPHVTVDDYGGAADPKPIFSRFNAVYTTGQWSIVAGTANSRCWKATENATVSWLREANCVNNVYRQMTSIVAVDATPSSWWEDTTAHLIYVNPTADTAANANPTNGSRCFESVTANTNNAIRVGFAASVDDVLIQNIRVDGWTANIADAGGDNIQSFLTGTDAIVYRGVEAYFGDRHGIVNTSTTGGICTMVQCKYGWMTSTQGQDAAVVYSGAGGQEAVWNECEVIGGLLPVGAQPYGNATQGSAGQIAHTDGAAGHTVGLFIAYGCFNRPGQWQSGAMSFSLAPAIWTDLINCRSFVVNETFNAREVSPLDASAVPPSSAVFGVVGTTLGLSQYTVAVNCKFTSRILWDSNPYNGRQFIAMVSNFGTLINTSVNFDCVGSPNILWPMSRAMFNTCNGIFYNCRLHTRCYGTTGLAYSTIDVANTPTTGSSSIKTFNSVLSADGVGFGASLSYYSPGFGNIAANQINNAYSNASSAHKSQGEGYDQDPFYVEVSDLPFGHPATDSVLLTTHNQLVQGVYRLEYDADWTPRSLTTPAIGPYEPAQSAVTPGRGRRLN